MGDQEQIVIRVANALETVDPLAWDACANPGGDIPYNPFTSYSFLNALEKSGSATMETGWAPYHLLLETPSGDLAGCMPLYLKSHSQGEYVFDYGWADAFERAGGRYYPKLLSAVPFTPATGRRLLVNPLLNAPDAEDYLIAGCVEITKRLDVSSLHLNFLPQDQWERLGDHGFLRRMDQQFHWENNGFETFDAFLDALASRKRKQIRKERNEALSNDIEIEWVTGNDLTDAHWDAFFNFYMDTGSRKWGSPYLTRDFFTRINQAMPDKTLLILAKRAGRYIAGALNFIGGDTLFGRNWGCVEDHRFLHFEVCYYQAIDFAIAHGLKRVEAGAQGAHKLARGYMPQETYSAHWIANPSFRTAVSDYLENERAFVQRDVRALAQHSPFKKIDNIISET